MTKRNFLMQLNMAIMTALILSSSQTQAIVHCQDENGSSALMLASETGNSKICALLLTNVAHVDRQNNTGKTALMYASKNGHI